MDRPESRRNTITFCADTGPPKWIVDSRGGSERRGPAASHCADSALRPVGSTAVDFICFMGCCWFLVCLFVFQMLIRDLKSQVKELKRFCLSLLGQLKQNCLYVGTLRYNKENKQFAEDRLFPTTHT